MTEPIIARLGAALADRYRIERELGAGGMATVFLAHDIKHDRDVAIKVLHPDLGAALGGDRFLSEIKTTAKLQHPHILPLLDSGDADGLLYYVMPVVTGETLRARLERERQLPIGEAVRIAREIASALDYAHRQSVIHRDIKPENILLHDGQALVADFGIALAVQTAGGQRMTQTGLSLGTPQYMSPEQAIGERSIDARADVYALAAVTYEMLTGDPPFTGSSVQAVLAKVMSERPTPLHLIRDTVPLAIEQAVLTGLAKLPADRFGTAAEFSAALANPNATTSASSAAIPVTARSGARTLIGAGALGVAALIVGLVIGTWRNAGRAGTSNVIRTSLSLGDSAAVRAIGNLRLAISPLGDRVVFVGASGTGDALWVREFNQPVAHVIPDTKGAFDPFMSPDGKSIGFFTSDAGKTALKIIATDGAGARTAVPDSVVVFGGGSWGDDGNIYFTHVSRGLARVPADGGTIVRISRPDSAHGEQEHDFPEVLPGSRFAVIMLWKGSVASNRIGVVDLRTGATRELTAGSFARYAAPGYLAIGMGDGRVFVAPFDAKKGTLTGTPVMMLPDVQVEAQNGTVQFAVSRNGTIVYQQRVGSSDALVWVDRTGRETPVDTTITGSLGPMALSPDATQIAITKADASGAPNIWVKHLSTGAFSRLSLGVTDVERPAWTPDGRYVGYLARRGGEITAWVRRADGSDTARRVVRAKMGLDEIGFDPAGRYTLLRSEGTGPGTRRLLILENGRDTIPRVLIKSSFDHYSMVLSPDAKWLAYASDESGSPEVYVRPFPNVDSARFPISAGGGVEPLWSRDGHELFFRNVRGAMLSVPVTTGSHFSNGMPKLLFSAPSMLMTQYFRHYDVHPDGKRFLMVSSGGQDSKRLEAIFNWQVELQRLKSGGK